MADSTEQNLNGDAIRVEGLSHRYPKAERPALDGVSFSVARGEVFGVLGPNGGGKTTLFKVLSTMLGASGGRAEVFGHDVAAEPGAVRGRLGVVFQSPSLDGQLTAVENLKHHGKLYGLNGKVLAERIDRWLDFFGLADRRGEYVARFSGGMRRRLEIAKALLHEPGLLLMDEPATGLDPAGRRDMWQKLKQLRDESGMTVVLTTHLMDEAEHCDRLAIMSAGKLVAVDSPTTLKSCIGGDVITLEPEDGEGIEELAKQIAGDFGPWGEGAAPIVVDGRVHFEKEDGARVVAEVAGKYGWQIRSVTVGRPTLEDVFMHMTGGRLGAD